MSHLSWPGQGAITLVPLPRCCSFYYESAQQLSSSAAPSQHIINFRILECLLLRLFSFFLTLWWPTKMIKESRRVFPWINNYLMACAGETGILPNFTVVFLPAQTFSLSLPFLPGQALSSAGQAETNFNTASVSRSISKAGVLSISLWTLIFVPP